MDFKTNLDFAQVMLRYAIMMGLGIIAGALQAWWMLPFVMFVFVTALMGFDPLKAFVQSRRSASRSAVKKEAHSEHTYHRGHRLAH